MDEPLCRRRMDCSSHLRLFTVRNPAERHHFDPLKFSSRSPIFSRSPFSWLKREIQRQKRVGGRLVYCSLELATQPRTSSNCRGFGSDPHVGLWVASCTHGAFFGSSRRALLHLGRANSRGFQTRVFSPQNGGGGPSRTILNLAGAGLLTYLTVTGKLNFLFDAIFSLWLIVAVLWWLAERNLIKGLCPNCGGEFQVFEFSMKEEHRLCPYCSQPFKLENKQFVREDPQFSNQQQRGFKQPFGGFGQPVSSSKKEKSSGVVVDIEAQVRDKD